VTRLVEAVVPARLGTGFRLLLASSWITNLGDGIVLAAGPLLVASMTDDARLVALGATLQWLPPLLFGLLAGALSDRLDRRRLVMGVNLARAGVLAALATTIVTGHVSIAVVLVALFLLGTTEVFADNATSTLLPMLVHRDDLAIANARVQAGFVTVNQLVGPPIGAALFAAGAALPFGAEALLVAAGAILISRLHLPPVHDDAAAAARDRHLGRDILEGVRFAWRQPAVRTLVLTLATFNVTYGAAWAVLVLYARDRLGLGEVGYGLLTSVSAAGGLVATLLYGRLVRVVSLANLMRIGLIIETLTHVALALTTRPWVAMAIMFVFGAHAFVWGTTSMTIRQRVVPLRLQGRVNSVNVIGSFGGLVLGSVVGGPLAQHWGVTAPFWFAAAGSAVFVVAIWHQLRHIALAEHSVVVDER
jgi:MFS family permease